MPAMTKDERNARQRDLRFQRVHSRYQSCLSTILESWITGKREKQTHAQILANRSHNKPDNLPNWVCGRLLGADDVCFARTFREDLVFCYPHPLTGVITPAGVICDEGLASMLSEKGLDKQGAHYWKNADGTFTHRFS